MEGSEVSVGSLSPALDVAQGLPAMEAIRTFPRNTLGLHGSDRPGFSFAQTEANPRSCHCFWCLASAFGQVQGREGSEKTEMSKQCFLKDVSVTYVFIPLILES